MKTLKNHKKRLFSKDYGFFVAIDKDNNLSPLIKGKDLSKGSKQDLRNANRIVSKVEIKNKVQYHISYLDAKKRDHSGYRCTHKIDKQLENHLKDINQREDILRFFSSK